MFTGLVEEIGSLSESKFIGGGKRLKIKADKILKDIHIDDSICVNGVCLTVVNYTNEYFEADVIEETLLKSNINTLKIGDKLNLESSLTLQKKLGGHILQGHIDTSSKVSGIIKNQTQIQIIIIINPQFRKYLVPVGSIGINGVSLTVAGVEDSSFRVAVIPYTWANTNLQFLKTGDIVNLEFDIIGKYVESMLKYK